MNDMIFVVRWQDDSGKPQSKEYGDETTARKAKAWLLDRGIKAVDIAIKKMRRVNNGSTGIAHQTADQGVRLGCETKRT